MGDRAPDRCAVVDRQLAARPRHRRVIWRRQGRAALVGGGPAHRCRVLLSRGRVDGRIPAGVLVVLHVRLGGGHVPPHAVHEAHLGREEGGGLDRHHWGLGGFYRLGEKKKISLGPALHNPSGLSGLHLPPPSPSVPLFPPGFFFVPPCAEPRAGCACMHVYVRWLCCLWVASNNSISRRRFGVCVFPACARGMRGVTLRCLRAVPGAAPWWV